MFQTHLVEGAEPRASVRVVFFKKGPPRRGEAPLLHAVKLSAPNRLPTLQRKREVGALRCATCQMNSRVLRVWSFILVKLRLSVAASVQ